MINTIITDKLLLGALKSIDWDFDTSDVPKHGRSYVDIEFTIDRDFVFPVGYNDDTKEEELTTMGEYLGEEFESVKITDDYETVFDYSWGLQEDDIVPVLCNEIKETKCPHCGSVKATAYVSRSMELFAEKFCKPQVR